MTFTECFSPYVCAGDTIACDTGGFRIVARIAHDPCPDAPDKRQDGFWPSLIKDAPGFIGPGPNFRDRFAKAKAEADAVMEAWRKDEWFYCGIVLSVFVGEVELAPNAATLWGVETNYPGTDNAYLTDIANELLPDALAAAREAAEHLCRKLGLAGARA